MKKNYKKLLFFAALVLSGWSVRAQFPAPYCSVTFPDGVEPITLVSFGSINNTTAAPIGGAALENYTAQLATVTPSLGYPITLKGNTDGNFTNFIRVFADWNQDGDFADAGESYDIGTINNSTGVDDKQVTGTVAVPLTALQGTTRLRVLKRFNAYGEPCNSTGFGQAEDYTLTVTAPPACIAPTGLTLVGTAGVNTATVSWTAPATPPAGGYEYITSTSNTPPSAATSGTPVAGTTATINNLAPGAVNYVWVRSNCGTEFSAWSSTALSILTLPSNDDCANAIPLTVNPDFSCSAVTNATTGGATQSIAAAPCSGNPDDDVWFSFVATGTQHRITLSNITAITGTSTDMYFQVLSGACGSTASVFCSDPNDNVITGLTPGQTYYVRVYSFGTTSRQTFSICVGSFPPAPANDSCEGAVALTVNPDLGCGVTTTGTTLSATQTMAATPCLGNPDDDVWYSFVATDTQHRITLSNVTAVLGTSTDMYFQVLSGACGTMTSVLCSDPNDNTATGLTPGETYYVRVYSFANTSRQTFSICVGTIPSAPANDNCEGAIALTVNPDLACGVTTTGTTVSATQTMAATPCSGTPDDDVWYSFVATAAEHRVTLSNVTAIFGTSTDMYFQVLSGACGSMASVLCSDPNDNIITGLTPGETYYIRVYSFGSTSRQSFNICVGSFPSAPANDNCEGAVALTVNTDLNCTATTTGTTLSATETMSADPCSGNPDDDVWFSFVATGSQHRIALSNVTAVVGTSTDMYFQVLSGACGSMNSILCSDPNTGVATGLTPGETYYVRVYSFGTTSRQNFNICVGSFPAPPANDDCEAAVALTVNTDFNCAATTTGTTFGATQTLAAAPCSGTPDDDVWYSFVATNTSHRIVLSNVSAVFGTSTDMYMQVLSGTCGSQTSVQCSDPNTMNLTSLTPGETYYVRVYSFGNAAAYNNFTICVGTPPPPPANDDCEGAITLTVNPDLTCAVTTTGTTQSATNYMAAAPCSGNPDDDVFYKFTATSESHRITLSNVTAVDGTSTDIYFQVLNGVCGSLGSVLCSDPNDNTVTGLNPGEEYYIRVYSFGDTSRQTFTICVGTLPAPPSNDDCEGAITLTVNPDLACTATTAGTTVSATNYMAADPCSGNPDDDVFFKFTATAQTHRISLSNVVAIQGTSTDMYWQVLEGICGALGSVQCSDPDTGYVSGLVPGNEYYVRVYSFSATSRQTFNICVGTSTATAPANDNCANATVLAVSPTTTCAAQTQGTTVGANQSMAAAPCAGTPDDDVWYSFVANGVTQTITLSNVTAVVGTSTDMYFQVLSGACGTMTSILCSDPNTATVGGLTAGETYYIRVYSFGATSQQTFDICVTTPPAPPANDNCDAAVALTVNPDFSCAAVTAGTTVGATQSLAAAPCSGNPDDDVWYSFVATATGHRIVLSGITAVSGTSTDMYMQILSGVCGTLTSVQCSDPNTMNVSGLTIGQTYYIRVYGFGSDSRQTFNICVGTPPPPPTNDDCANAIALTAGSTFETNPVTATNVGATGSTGAPAPGCASYSGGDVWYSVTVPASGSITVETAAVAGSAILDTGLALYSGACGSMTLIQCSDDEGTDNYSIITLTGRTAGEVIYIRAWEFSNDATGTFRLSAYDASLSNGDIEASSFRYYPNPVKDVLNLSHTTEITSVSVYNLLGQQVLAKDINATDAAIDLSSLNDGTYIVNITAGETVKTVKIIKKQ